MATYYIGADVHNNSTELAIEKRGKIVARYKVPTSITAISNVLDSLQGKKYLAVEVEVTLMVSMVFPGSEFLLRHWTCFIHSPHYVNEPEPFLLCLNNLHGLPGR